MRNWIVILVILGSLASLHAQTTKKVKRTPYWQHRVDHFRTLPDIKNEVIFLGNSISDGAEWAELLKNPKCLNRGISGDVTDGILERLDEVTARHPKKLFLLIGVNDLARGRSDDYIVEKHQEIYARIRKESPKTKLYVQSILPVNPVYGQFKGHTNKTERIISINKRLQALAEKEGHTFIDLFSHMAIEDNLLNPDLSVDGLHMNGKGYLIWKGCLKSYL